MKIEINTKATSDATIEWFNNCVKAITFNAENGIDTTDLYVPKHIASDVRERLEKEIENISFLTVARRVNEYTGSPFSVTTEIVGDDKHYKVRLK